MCSPLLRLHILFLQKAEWRHYWCLFVSLHVGDRPSDSSQASETLWGNLVCPTINCTRFEVNRSNSSWVSDNWWHQKVTNFGCTSVSWIAFRSVEIAFYSRLSCEKWISVHRSIWCDQRNHTGHLTSKPLRDARIFVTSKKTLCCWSFLEHRVQAEPRTASAGAESLLISRCQFWGLLWQSLWEYMVYYPKCGINCVVLFLWRWLARCLLMYTCSHCRALRPESSIIENCCRWKAFLQKLDKTEICDYYCLWNSSICLLPRFLCTAASTTKMDFFAFMSGCATFFSCISQLSFLCI